MGMSYLICHWLKAITASGGLVGDLEGNDVYLKSGDVVAGNPKMRLQLWQT